MKKQKEHKYTRYKPEWCQHPPFHSAFYCWGLAVHVDDGTLEDWLKQKCETCPESKYYFGDAELERRFGEKG